MARRYPLSSRGTLVLAVSVLALWLYGYGDLDLVLFVVGLSGLLLVLMALIAVVIGAWQVRRGGGERRLDLVRLEAGSLVRTGYAVPALGKLPLAQVSWRWLWPEGVKVQPRRRGKQLLEEVVATRRAQVSKVERLFSVHDAFGLCRVRWQQSDASPLTILPSRGRLQQTPVVHSVAAAEGMPHPAGRPEGDRMEIRAYVPGDSIRHILWKTYARTGELNVRLPEKSAERARRTVAYLVSSEEDEAAAAAARVALEGGSLGPRWLFGADGTRDPAEELEPALEAIARSGSLRTKGAKGRQVNRGTGLASFLQRMHEEGEGHCIVFAPARPGPWAEVALEAARSGPAQLSFVVAADGVDRRAPSSLWQRLLWLEEGTQGVPSSELDQLMGRLSGTGAPIVVVDRDSGRAFAQGRGGAGNTGSLGVLR